MSQINTSSILLAFFAILFGLAGTYAVRVLRHQEPVVAPAETIKPPVKIVVPLASRNIASGTQITLDDVALYKMTREEIKTKIAASSFMTNPKQIIGKILLNEMKSGRPFKTQDFYPTGTSPGIAKRLPPGMRAMTIVLDPTDALIGFAGPGQRVDVLFHYYEDGAGSGNRIKGPSNGQIGFYPQHHDFNPPTRHRDYWGNSQGGGGSFGSSEFQNATSTLVQDAEILALGKRSVPTDAASGLPVDEGVAVTLAVRPRDAELLRVAEGHGKLSLTLRGPTDDERKKLVDPVTLSQIFDVQHTSQEMEIYRGTAMSHVHFSKGQVIQSKVFGSTSPEQISPSNNQPNHNSPPPQVPTYVPVWPMQPGYYTKPVSTSNGMVNPNNASHPNRPASAPSNHGVQP